RDDGLAGSDVTLEQPLHGHRALQIGVDLLDRALLVLGQRERQQPSVALDELSRRAEGRRDLRLALPAAAGDSELQKQELVEREPAPAALRFLERAWPVQPPQRVAAARESL